MKVLKLTQKSLKKLKEFCELVENPNSVNFPKQILQTFDVLLTEFVKESKNKQPGKVFARKTSSKLETSFRSIESVKLETKERKLNNLFSRSGDIFGRASKVDNATGLDKILRINQRQDNKQIQDLDNLKITNNNYA